MHTQTRQNATAQRTEPSRVFREEEEEEKAKESKLKDTIHTQQRQT